MSLKSDRFELKRAHAEPTEGEQLAEMLRSIDKFEASDIANASTPEQVDRIRSEAEADRATAGGAMADYLRSLEVENFWRGKAQVDPIGASLVLELLQAGDDEAVMALMSDIGQRFTEAAQPAEVDDSYVPADIDPNLPAPIALRQGPVPPMTELEQQTAQALKKATVSTHTNPLGELPEPRSSARDYSIYRKPNIIAIGPDEMVRRAEERNA